MHSKTLVISIIYIFCSSLITIKGFPKENNVRSERLEPRGLGDYVSSWFWSSQDDKDVHANVPIVDSNYKKLHISKNIKDNGVPDDDNSHSRDNVDMSKILTQSIDYRNLQSKEIEPMNEIPTGFQSENSEKILEELQEDIQNINDEEKNERLSLWKSLTDTVSKTSAPYVQVVYKNARHIIDIGAYGSSKRGRCLTEMVNPLGGLLGMIFKLLGLFGGNSNNAGLSLLGLGMPPAALSSSQSNANANALAALGGLTGASSPGVKFVSLQDLANMGTAAIQQPPNLGGGAQSLTAISDLLRLGGNTPQGQSNTGLDMNSTLLVALLMRLLTNGGSAEGINNLGIDFSKLPKDGKNSNLMALIRQLADRKIQSDDDDDDKESRVILVKRRRGIDGSNDSNDFDVFNVIGTPEERFRKIKRKFRNKPSMEERIIILDELNKLRNDDKINDEDLKIRIKELEQDIKSDKDYANILEILKLSPNEKNKPKKFGSLEIYDNSGKKLSKSFSDDENAEKLLEEFVGSLTKKYKSRNINDSKTFEDLLRDLNVRRFGE